MQAELILNIKSTLLARLQQSTGINKNISPPDSKPHIPMSDQAHEVPGYSCTSSTIEKGRKMIDD